MRASKKKKSRVIICCEGGRGGGQSVRYFYYKNLIKLEIFRGVRTNPNPQSDPSRSDYVETIWLINYKTCSLIYHQIVK